MLVWKDILSGDEMVTDTFPYSMPEEYNNAALMVKGKYITKKSEFVAIASDDVDDGDADGETVVDIVDAMRLQEVQLTKKDFMGIIKVFLGKLAKQLEADGKGDRVGDFKKGATGLVKFVVGKFDEFQFYVGESYDMEASLAMSYTADGEENPTFFFFLDAMREEKL
uniref:TCTP domain-containing protein n=1 Tax=Strombidinopsis acuminata TaxID=141414 RepID=A0A7S3SVM1_9SPIT|mmetsp:Transcript_44847/g.60850  ORF Transcript_44847/g.60850 Transcript_44847/m.60850 type:complete len:167 (+) Transcript_44847:72-572(+)